MSGTVKRVNKSSSVYRTLVMHKGINMLDKMIAYENGELSDQETTDLFSELIKNKMVWQLQGSYGRMAMSLIRAGYLTVEGEKGENYAW